MIRLVTNQPRDYAWGSTTLIPDYFGLEQSGAPMAEIWFGTHPAWPTQLVGEPNKTLLSLREQKSLSFLLKILAAGQPLSLQAHPNAQQAVEGFAAENLLGIPLDAPNRNYKDDKHKPEMLVALTPFDALAGFRPIEESLLLFRTLATDASPVLSQAFAAWVPILERGIQEFFVFISGERGRVASITQELANLELGKYPEHSAHLQLVTELQELYPGDPGIIVTLLMNHMHLEPQQALQLSAGQVHAYVRGLGVEVMANSDNVLRGGLTPKHVDVAELQKVVIFEGAQNPVLSAKQLMTGLYEYPRLVEDYLLYRVEVSSMNLLADLKLQSEAIFLCTEGEVAVSNSLGEREVLRKGQAAYLADAKFFSFAGNGTGYLATC